MKFFGYFQYDQGFGIKIVALFIQFPNYLDPNSTFICSAFGSFKVLVWDIIDHCCWNDPQLLQKSRFIPLYFFLSVTDFFVGNCLCWTVVALQYSLQTAANYIGKQRRVILPVSYGTDPPLCKKKR
jgi:hypothetical protein